MEVPLISEELFKAYSPVTYNTGVKEFIPYIIIAQKLYIEKILGKPLTEELQDQIKAAEGGTEITPDNGRPLKCPSLLASYIAFITFLIRSTSGWSFGIKYVTLYLAGLPSSKALGSFKVT